MTTQILQVPTVFVILPQTKQAVKQQPKRCTQALSSLQIATHIRQNLSDEELMLAICGSAEWALELLYERYQRYAHTLAYRILQDYTAAEDIVQETFFSIWLKAASFERQSGSVRGWLQAIVHHKAIDKVRSPYYRDSQCAALQTEYEQDPADEQPDVWEEAWRDEQRSIIHSVLEQIPAEQRQVIELAYFGGYTHVEIAEKWDIPLGTVKGRMRLGLQKMKQLLTERGIDLA